MRYLILFLILLFSFQSIFACTNFLITRGASEDGSTMITYAADSHVLYGELYYRPPGIHIIGTMIDVYEWDTGKYLGQIPQVEETYSVVGNMNEYQVSIGETTWGGHSELIDSTAIMDYGSLMYIALQRSKTAREAIDVMTCLVAEYGYFSSGETFSIADPYEVWIMEMIGKGSGNRGAAWVARRVPDGYISAHANNPRITTLPLKDKKNCLYAPDVISFAREKGYFTENDQDFNYAKAYTTPDYGALRFCDTRVWAMYNRAAPSLKLPTEALKGKSGDPLPLWIKPDKKVSVRDVMEFMRDHFENSEFDLSKGIGAGPYQLPYRWRPLTWTIDSTEYFNERSTSTQQTGFSFVAQARKWLPNPIGGVLWFGVDDTYSSVYVPMYCGILSAPHNFSVGTGSFKEFSWESAFWIFNWVSNYAYIQYSRMIIEIQKVQRELEGMFIAKQDEVDEAAKAIYYNQSPIQAREYLTNYSHEMASLTIKRWKKLGEFLLWKFLDGNMKDESGNVTHPGYTEAWYRCIIRESGDFYKYTPLPGEGDGH